MYKNSKGTIYYHHVTDGKNGIKLHYFSRIADGYVPVPDGYEVLENKRNGLPYIKKVK